MWQKILLLFFVLAFLFRSDLSFDQDLGRHLKMGEIILQEGSIPKTNLFSFTNPEFKYVNTHWLFGVMAYWFSESFGLQALLILKVLIILSAVWLIIRKINNPLLLPIGFIFLHVLRERLELRPEIFSFLFTALTLYILNLGRPRLLFLLPLIQLLWINTHIYFFVGLALQAIFLLAHLQGVQIRVLILILSIVFSLANPQGLNGLLYPLKVSENYGYSIVENQTMFLLESINFADRNFLFVKLSIGLAGLILLISLLRKRFDLKNILLASFGMALALLNVRSFPYLVFLTLPAIMQMSASVRISKFISLGFAVLVLGESIFYLTGSYYKYTDSSYRPGLKLVESGKEAVDFTLDNDLPQPFYNNFDIGSYIIYRGFPVYKVFVDGRPEAYPKKFFQEVYIPSQSDYSKFKALEQSLNLETVIFSHTDQTPWGRSFLQAISRDDSYALAFVDDYMVIFVKKSVLEDKRLYEITSEKIIPEAFRFDNHLSYIRIGMFLLNTGQTDNARKFIEKALEVFPDSPTANLLMSQIAPFNPQYQQKSKNLIFW
ncbi:hypothetical protein HYU96_00585 [Candidatus Daviesbacteria bacterium]|nr:hypothetical protein [Candidatus Daviesbacteria bacterium]